MIVGTQLHSYWINPLKQNVVITIAYYNNYQKWIYTFFNNFLVKRGYNVILYHRTCNICKVDMLIFNKKLFHCYNSNPFWEVGNRKKNCTMKKRIGLSSIILCFIEKEETYRPIEIKSPQKKIPLVNTRHHLFSTGICS